MFWHAKLLTKRTADTFQALEEWVADGTVLESRAAAATAAAPILLKNEETAKAALYLHQELLNRVRETPTRKAQDFKTLRKALGYTLSVVVEALPEPGFDYLAELAASSDRDVKWIVRQNLKKKRLVKSFAEQVAATQSLLD